nr:TetR/AcrR family transcriptional regulator C-terminal ligand-binding domain-containing protein [Planobispora longispora]
MVVSDRGARTRRRGEELIRAIHDAVLEEVVEVGVGRLTMDGIGGVRRHPAPRCTAAGRIRSRCSSTRSTTSTRSRSRPGADDLRGDLIRALRLMVEWALSPAGRAVAAILTDPKSAALMSEALFERVFASRGGTFTRTVLRHYADRGRFPAELLTPVVADIGEALVTKRLIDTGAPPADEDLAAIVDQAILPAIGLGPRAPRA